MESLCEWDELHVAAAVGDAAAVQVILQKKTGKPLKSGKDHVCISRAVAKPLLFHFFFAINSTLFSTSRHGLDTRLSSRHLRNGVLTSTFKIR